jgi:hypothetical protein
MYLFINYLFNFWNKIKLTIFSWNTTDRTFCPYPSKQSRLGLPSLPTKQMHKMAMTSCRSQCFNFFCTTNAWKTHFLILLIIEKELDFLVHVYLNLSKTRHWETKQTRIYGVFRIVDKNVQGGQKCIQNYANAHLKIRILC